MTKKKKLIIISIAALIVTPMIVWLASLLMWNNAQKEMEEQNEKLN